MVNLLQFLSWLEESDSDVICSVDKWRCKDDSYLQLTITTLKMLDQQRHACPQAFLPSSYADPPATTIEDFTALNNNVHSCMPPLCRKWHPVSLKCTLYTCICSEMAGRSKIPNSKLGAAVEKLLFLLGFIFLWVLTYLIPDIKVWTYHVNKFNFPNSQY